METTWHGARSVASSVAARPSAAASWSRSASCLPTDGRFLIHHDAVEPRSIPQHGHGQYAVAELLVKYRRAAGKCELSGLGKPPPCAERVVAARAENFHAPRCERAQTPVSVRSRRRHHERCFRLVELARYPLEKVERQILPRHRPQRADCRSAARQRRRRRCGTGRVLRLAISFFHRPLYLRHCATTVSGSARRRSTRHR